jgi:crotonobetainyl-CoA:carnitine CoA-transferase CaiB-like acyl-CoA transferase
LMQEPIAHWVEVLNAKGIPAGGILSLEEALNSEQARHRAVIAQVEQPGIGQVRIFNLSAKFSGTPAQIVDAPPALSQHTDIILEELGYSAEERQGLRSRKVI